MKRINEEVIVDAHKINYDTGEVTKIFGKFITDKQLEAQRAYKERKTEQYEMQKDYGAFIWLLFEYSKKLLPNIKSASLTRLIYLSTYLNYKGYLSFDNGQPIEKKHIQELLNLKDRAFATYYKEMLSNQIFEGKDDLIYLNSDIFIKGKISKIDSDFTRVCITGVRQLYTSADIKSHKQLSYIFRILPYVSRRYNIICYNPEEVDINLIKPMSIGEFCDIINYDKSKAKRLMNSLIDCTFNGDMIAIKYVAHNSLDIKTFRIIINPKVYYGGDNHKEVEVLGTF